MERSSADVCTLSFFLMTGALAAAEQLVAHVDALLEHTTQYEPHSTNDTFHEAAEEIARIIAAIRTDIAGRFPNRLHVTCALAGFLHDMLVEEVRAARKARFDDFVQWLYHQHKEEEA